MKTVIKVSRPEDLVAYIPYSLGFRPTESAVLVGMRAGGPGLGLSTRVDLAGLAHPEAGPSLVAQIADCLARDGCDDAFVVLYTDEPRHGLAEHPVVRGALDRLRELTSWADAPGPWVVGGGTYGCWGDAVDCAPATKDVTELEEGWLAATMVMHGKNLADSRDALRVPSHADADLRRVAVRAERSARAQLLAARSASLDGTARGAAFGLPAPSPLAEWRETQWLGWRRLVAKAGADRALPPADLACLAVALEDPLFRDGVLCSLVQPMPRSVPTSATAITALEDAMRDGGPEPRPDRTEPAEAVLRATVGALGESRAAHALAALAWLAWWCGDGARADVVAQQALDSRPGTRLAELVQQTLDAQLAPGWVGARSTDRVRRRSIR